MIRFVFMGTPEFAKIILASLHEDERFECVAVVSQPDRPVGRKHVLTPPSVALYASSHAIPLFQPEKIDDLTLQALKKYHCDFVVVAAFGQILSSDVLSLAPCINLHTSLLPSYRGASPLQETLLNGDPFAGITAIRMDEGLDTGDILGYSYIEVPPHAKYGCFLDKLGFIAANLAKDVMGSFEHISPLPQHHCDASKVKKHHKSEGLIDFSHARQLKQKFSAFHPWPGVYCHNGLKLKELEFIEVTSHNEEGKILAIEDDGVIVGCGQGSIKLVTVQPLSKNEMSAKAYLLGQRRNVGDCMV